MKQMVFFLMFFCLIAWQTQAKTIVIGVHGGPDVYFGYGDVTYYSPFVKFQGYTSDFVGTQNNWQEYGAHGVDAAIIYFAEQTDVHDIKSLIVDGGADYYSIVAMNNFIVDNRNDGDKVVLIGYSAGAKYVIYLSHLLRLAGCSVDILALIDAIIDENIFIPSNVVHLAVYHQQSDVTDFQGFNSFIRLSPSKTSYYNDHPKLVTGATINHYSIIYDKEQVWQDLGQKMVALVDNGSGSDYTNDNSPAIFIEGNHTHIIHDDYRCSKATNGPILCWESGLDPNEPDGRRNCWNGWKWYQFNGEVNEVADHRTDSDWITILDRSMCAVVYNSNGSGTSTGGAWHSGGPYPDDPIYDNDPFVPNADVSIRYLEIKGPGQSNHHTESGAVFYPGQTQSVDLKGKIKNESNDNTDMARIQYCATTKKKFRHDERIWIDEDYLDHQEREHDFDPGETITKHGQAFITLASDLSSITVFKGNRSHTFPITQKHLYEKKIPIYFWIDTKVEVGNDEDYDVSCSVGSECGDEYAKFEVLLPWFNSSFNLSSVGGEASLQVNFTNTSQTGNGATISYYWDFGDGETSSEENPVHIYNQAGTYIVNLTTTSNWGETRTSRATVVVTDSPIDGVVDTNYGSTDLNSPKVLAEELTEGHCFSGTPTTLLGMGVEGNPWEWTCQGENGGADETGYAVLEEEETDPRADVNGDGYIDSSDVNLVMMYSLGFDMSGTGWVDSSTTGDVNCDNTTNTTDAMLISRYVNGGDMAGTGWCAE